MSSCPSPRLDNDSHTVLCPVCRGENAHLVQVTVDQLGSTVIVGAAGTVLRAHDCDRRGSAVQVQFYCESGHSFAVQFEFYKGSTYVGYEPTAGFTPGGEGLGELARD